MPTRTLAGDALREHALHRLREAIDLGRRGVDGGGDADALELVVLDADDEDPVLRPQVIRQSARVDALDLDQRDAGREAALQARVQLDALVGREALGPAVAQP